MSDSLLYAQILFCAPSPMRLALLASLEQRMGAGG